MTYYPFEGYANTLVSDEDQYFYPDVNTNRHAQYALAEPNEMLHYADFDLFEYAPAESRAPEYWNDFPHYLDHANSYIAPSAYPPLTPPSGPSTETSTPTISAARTTTQRKSNNPQSRSRRGPEALPSPSPSSSSSFTITTTTSRSSPVSCPHCPLTFPRPCDLNRHLHRHFPTFQCSSPGCTEAFALRKDCRRHEQCVHGISSTENAGNSGHGNKKNEKQGLKCVVRDCGYTSLRRDNWRRHLRKVHAIRMD